RRSRRIHETARRQRRQQGAMAAAAAESIGAVKVIHALSLEGTFAQAFTRQNRKNLATGAYATRLSAGLERTVDLLIALGTALVLWLGARLVLRGAMTPGDLVVFLAYVKNAFRPVKDAAKYTGSLAKASAAREYTLASLRAQMSVVLQDSLLFAATVRDNIAYGAPGASQDAIEAAARVANAASFIEALPQGYDTVLGERGVTLSHGQRQRIT